MMEQPADLLGWAATAVLIATLVRQIAPATGGK